ncbi:MAG: hydrogenase maturation protease, partial [Proteobacteria bacterium]|nr:hydrogenase maturation protease [Pseudomonadota bacterium]
APILIFGWGNPSRGDDALGPLFVARIEALKHPDVECLTDFQLQVEHALDLQGRQRVLFVDASIDAPAPFSITPIFPGKDASFTSHAMTPQAILHTYVQLEGSPPPPCWLLAIRGESFELGEPLAPAAEQHLAAALQWTESWLNT